NVVRDLKMGMSDADLMQKYNLSAKGLQSLFGKLVRAKLITQTELQKRMPFAVTTVDVDMALSDAGLEELSTESQELRIAAQIRVERDGLLARAKEELSEVNRKILEGDPSLKARLDKAPVGLGKILDPFQWFFQQVGDGDDYIRWALGRACIIEIVSLSEIVTDNKICQRIRQAVRGAHDIHNALTACRVVPKAVYCEGWIVSGFEQNLPIKHAWNRINSSHFDLKLELARENLRNLPTPIYILAQELDADEALSMWDMVREDSNNTWGGEPGRAHWEAHAGDV
ncbi:MAG: hypothetical protein V2B18_16970, partial [Pseudomonadota bacterium]